MASLDQILDRMAARGADCLVLRVGQIPIVRASGHDVPIQKLALSEDQVLALVRELATPDAVVRLSNREGTSFTYRTFDVRVAFASSGVAVDIVPQDPLALPDDILSMPSTGEPAIAKADAGSSLELTGRSFELDDDAAAAPIELDASAAGPAARIVKSAAPLSAGPAEAASAGLHAAVPAPAPALPTVSAPGGFLDDVRDLFASRRVQLAAVVALGVFGVTVAGALWWRSRPVQLPNVVMADASGHPVTFDDMRGSSPSMVIVFVLPSCEMSRFALDSLKEAYPSHADRMAFAALYYGTQAEAERFAQDRQVPFPVYGLKDNKNPFLVRELMTRMGRSDWMVTGIYGGTTVLLDDRNRMIMKLEKEGVRQLPAKLAAL